MDRKYRQRGYEDRDRDNRDNRENREKHRERPDQPRPERPKQQPHDMLGPRTPRMVGSVTRARCANCGAVLAPGFDVHGDCPRCHDALHSCKQCVHFDTGKQFECTEPVPSRITKKDAKNDCSFFAFRMTIEKDTSPVTYATNNPPPAPTNLSPSRPNDARKAFEDLFKK